MCLFPAISILTSWEVSKVSEGVPVTKLSKQLILVFPFILEHPRYVFSHRGAYLKALLILCPVSKRKKDLRQTRENEMETNTEPGSHREFIKGVEGRSPAPTSLLEAGGLQHEGTLGGEHLLCVRSHGVFHTTACPTPKTQT